MSFDSATVVDDVDDAVSVACDAEAPSVFPVGNTVVTCTATDAAGNTGTGSFSVTVQYDWAGFFAPIDNALPDGTSVYNSVKAGAIVPVRFTLGGDMGLDILAGGSPTSRAVSCEAAFPVDALEETATAGGTSLSYDGTYVYKWKTDKSFKGCRELTVTLKDGTTHTPSSCSPNDDRSTPSRGRSTRATGRLTTVGSPHGRFPR